MHSYLFIAKRKIVIVHHPSSFILVFSSAIRPVFALSSTSLLGLRAALKKGLFWVLLSDELLRTIESFLFSFTVEVQNEIHISF